MFLLGCEVFTEFYTDSAHVASSNYLFFGKHGAHALVPWIWSAIAMNSMALLLLLTPSGNQNGRHERGLRAADHWHLDREGNGADRPRFYPQPAGRNCRVRAHAERDMVCLGIWAFGLLLYTIFVRITVPVLEGQLTIDTPGPGDRRQADAQPAPNYSHTDKETFMFTKHKSLLLAVLILIGSTHGSALRGAAIGLPEISEKSAKCAACQKKEQVPVPAMGFQQALPRECRLL